MRTACEILGPFLVVVGVAFISIPAALVVAGAAVWYAGTVQ